MKNRLGAHARVTSAPGDAPCRLKSPLGRPRSPKMEPVGSNGCPRGAFWETICHFLGDCGVLLDTTHSQAKTYIFGFGQPQVGTCSSIFDFFQGVDFRMCVFISFLRVFLSFWCPRLAKVTPKGPKGCPIWISGHMEHAPNISTC